jgi:hypothetical protein
MASPAVNDDVADSRISRTEGGRSSTHQFDKEWAERSAQHGTSGGGSKALGEKITARSKQRGERGGVGGDPAMVRVRREKGQWQPAPP